MNAQERAEDSCRQETRVKSCTGFRLGLARDLNTVARNQRRRAL
jgi:hypothetical protein